MKTLLLSILIFSAHAHAKTTDYTGRFAKYTTTVQTAGGSASAAGESEIRVLGLDATSQKFTVQVLHRNPQGVEEKSSSIFTESELDGQMQGTIFNHCLENYGLSAEVVVVKGNPFQACRIHSSNTSMDLGLVPFSILKSVSKGTGGKVFTTLLIDYQI